MTVRTPLVLLGILANGFAQSASPAPVTFAVHVLVPCSTPGAGQPVRFAGVDAALCLDGTPFLTQKDVRSAELRQNSQGHPVVFLTLRESAAIRELEVTRKNIGHRVGILVNGQVVAVPTVMASSRFVYIAANYTAKQAQELVDAFNKLAGNR
jgi:preprotein translocase subunit SecD